MESWRAVTLAVLAVAGLTACDPAPPADDATADLAIAINQDGSATVDLYLDTSQRTEGQLMSMGEAVGTRLFPAADELSVDVHSNDGGYPFVVINASGVYGPGERPALALDTRDAVAVLFAEDREAVNIFVGAPAVPVIAEWTPARPAGANSWSWQAVAEPSAAPVGEIVMSPEPSRGAVHLAVAASAVVFLGVSVLAFARRRRTPAVAMAAASLGGLAYTFFTVGAADNLAVAGTISRFWAQHTDAVGPLIFFTGVLALPWLIVTAVVPPPRAARRFVTPPGWPHPPEGWMPPPGWQPHSSWPPAPRGWEFYRDAEQ